MLLNCICTDLSYPKYFTKVINVLIRVGVNLEYENQYVVSDDKNHEAVARINILHTIAFAKEGIKTISF